jgi:hypothetical protein
MIAQPKAAPTQADQLLELLRERGTQGVTPLLALERIRSLRLAAVVFRLRAEGYPIRTDMVPVGEGKHVANYVLEERRNYEQLGLPL